MPAVATDRPDFTVRQFYTFPGADPAKPAEIRQEEIAQEAARDAYKKLFPHEEPEPAPRVKLDPVGDTTLQKLNAPAGPSAFARLLAFIRDFVRGVVGRVVGALGGQPAEPSVKEDQTASSAEAIQSVVPGDALNEGVAASISQSAVAAVNALCRDQALLAAIAQVGESNPSALADALDTSLAKIGAEYVRIDELIAAQQQKYETVRDALQTPFCSAEAIDRMLSVGGKAEVLVPDEVAAEMKELRDLRTAKADLDVYVSELVACAQRLAGDGDVGLERVLSRHPYAKEATLQVEADSVRGAQAAQQAFAFTGTPVAEVGPVRADVTVSMDLMARLKARQDAAGATASAPQEPQHGPVGVRPVFSKRSVGVGALDDGPVGIDLGDAEESQSLDRERV